jgi:hypothetical protein
VSGGIEFRKVARKKEPRCSPCGALHKGVLCRRNHASCARTLDAPLTPPQPSDTTPSRCTRPHQRLRLVLLVPHVRSRCHCASNLPISALLTGRMPGRSYWSCPRKPPARSGTWALFGTTSLVLPQRLLRSGALIPIPLPSSTASSQTLVRAVTLQAGHAGRWAASSHQQGDRAVAPHPARQRNLAPFRNPGPPLSSVTSVGGTLPFGSVAGLGHPLLVRHIFESSAKWNTSVTWCCALRLVSGQHPLANDA